jgi:hypothetical protein
MGVLSSSHFVDYLKINNYLSRFCTVLVLFQILSSNAVWNYVRVAHSWFCCCQGALFAISIVVFTASVIGLGAIVSAKPLDALGYKGWDADKKSFYSPYATSMYLGWALSSIIAVLITGVIPIVAWFATYRFSPSSALCVGLSASMSYLIFSQIRYLMLDESAYTFRCNWLLSCSLSAAVLVSFCGASYWGVVNSREDGIPLKADFLAALLPLLCIPAMFALFTGLYKWYKDDLQHLNFYSY